MATITNFHYKNADKQKKIFMYQNLKRANCYDTNFTGSNFDYASFRGAHMKDCDFYGCSFTETEFVGTNLKKSKFKEATFENALFEGVNLTGADFRGAIFKNTIFIGTDVTKAAHLNLRDPGITIYDEMPDFPLSEELEEAIREAMENKWIKEARVLDTKEGKINILSADKLLEVFDEDTLVAGLKYATKNLDKDFYVLSYLIRYIKTAIKQEKF